MTTIWPVTSSTASLGKNWSFLPDWSLILTGAAQCWPPSTERANQTRVLHEDVVEVSGASLGTLHPVPPARSCQQAKTSSRPPPLNAPPLMLISVPMLLLEVSRFDCAGILMVKL